MIVRITGRRYYNNTEYYIRRVDGVRMRLHARIRGLDRLVGERKWNEQKKKK